MKYPLRPSTLPVRFLVDPFLARSSIDAELYEQLSLRDAQETLGRAVVEQCAVVVKRLRMDLSGTPVEYTVSLNAVPKDETFRFEARSQTMGSGRWYVCWLSAAADYLWGLALKLEHSA